MVIFTFFLNKVTLHSDKFTKCKVETIYWVFKNENKDLQYVVINQYQTCLLIWRRNSIWSPRTGSNPVDRAILEFKSDTDILQHTTYDGSKTISFISHRSISSDWVIALVPFDVKSLTVEYPFLVWLIYYDFWACIILRFLTFPSTPDQCQCLNWHY